MINRDDRVFDFIEKFIDMHGYSPSSREIMLDTGISSSQLGITLRRLRRQNAISYKDGQPRTIVIIRYSLTKKGCG